MDLTSLQNSLYGDVENDEELLAELASLAGESKPKPKRAPVAKQVTPSMINAALKDDFSDIDDEDLENDEDLQRELAGMLDGFANEPVSVPSAQPVKTHPTPPKRAADEPPPLPARGVPPVPQRSAEAPPPPPPVRSEPAPPVQKSSVNTDSSNSKTLSEAERVRQVLKERFEAYALNLKLAKEANDIAHAKEFASMVEMFEQAIQAAEENDLTMSDLAEVPGMPPPYKPKKARPEPKNLIEDLEMRYDKLLELAEEYKNNGEDSKARRQVRLSGQFKDAIKALKKGQAVNIVELPLVPGLPKLVDMPYAKSAINTAPDSKPGPSQSSQPTRVPVSEPLQPKPKPVPVHQKPEEVTGDSTEKNQLRFLLTRQQQFKEAAIAAKKAGDIFKAKEMLLNAKKLEPMIQASEGGLPVDIRDVPLPPQSGVSRGLMRQFSAGADVQLQEVEKALLNQLSFCDQNRAAFNEKNDSRSVMIFEKLLSETKLDILHFRQLLQTGQRPSVKIVSITLPTLQETVEKGVSDDQLEVKIIGIEKLKSAEGYKPHHLAIYVKCNFAFPHDAHQSAKTQVISGTEHPEFNEVIYFKINRKIRQFYRSISRIPLKFEIYQKGSFLRSDKLWWTVEVPIAALEKQTLITSSAEIMEGRRKSTGGKLTVQVRVSRPLNDAESGGAGAASRKTAPTMTKKWIKVER